MLQENYLILLPYKDLVLLVVRFIMGTVMIYFGWPKIKNLKNNGKDFVKMGFKPGILWGTIVAIVEFFGGLAIIIGFYAWLPALLFGGEMIMGTLWKITKTDKPFSDWSYDLMLLVLALVILTFGTGDFALKIFC